MKKLITILAALLACVGANATETRTGTISVPYAAQVGNFPYRVVIGAAGSQCSSGTPFQYVNTTDGNYNVVVSQLMLAYMLGKSVTTVTDTAGSACHILEVKIN